MKYVLTGTGYLAGLVCAAGLFGSIAVYATGGFQRVTVDSLMVETGSVREGEQAKAMFRIRNSGWSTAEITNVRPGCGVMASLVGGRTLEQGEEGAVEVRMSTAGRQGPLVGTVTVTIRKFIERTVVLTMTAVAEPEFVIERPIVTFGTIFVRDGEARQEVRIRSQRTSSRVLRARSTDETFDAVVEGPHGSDWTTVVVTARQQTRPGLAFATVRIATSSPYMPELIVPVRAVFTN